MVDPKSLACSAALCASNMIGNKMAYSKKFSGDGKKGFRIIPLADDNTRVIYFERDSYNPKNVVNVLDENKTRIYSFERTPKPLLCLPSETLCPWDFITANHRQIIGAVGAKKEKSWIEFCNKEDMQYRVVKPQKKCICPKYQQFKQHRDDVSRFRWSRYSMTLDKVTPSGDNPCIENRQRVAYARKLSFLKCKSPLKKCAMKSQSKTIIDYQVTYDATLIDRELLVTTAFISMLTQWKLAKQQRSVASERISKKSQIKMIKTKAFIKAKRAIMVGAVATEVKTGMGIDKAKNAKGVLVKFMGGRVPPTVANPTGDPTLRSGRYSSNRPDKKSLIPAGLPECLPVPSCLPKIFPSCEGQSQACPPDRLINGRLAKEEAGNFIPLSICKPVNVCTEPPPQVCVIQPPVPVQPAQQQILVPTQPMVVPSNQTSVNIQSNGGYGGNPQGVSVPMQVNQYPQNMPISLVSAPVIQQQPQPVFVRQCAPYSAPIRASQCIGGPGYRQQQACYPKLPYPCTSAPLGVPTRQVFPSTGCRPTNAACPSSNLPVCTPKPICMPPLGSSYKPSPACGIQNRPCGLQSQTCRTDAPLRRGFYQ